MLTIRHSSMEDLPQMLDIYATARAFMAAHGNPRQWGNRHWPPEELLKTDIARQRSYVCVLDAGTPQERVVGTFCMMVGPHAEPCYDRITDGQWPAIAALGEEQGNTYGVVHRLAGDGSVPGIGTACLNWALEQCGHIRIDTHPDNIPMQHLLAKLGYERAGIIHVEEDNDPRYAYEKFV